MIATAGQVARRVERLGHERDAHEADDGHDHPRQDDLGETPGAGHETGDHDDQAGDDEHPAEDGETVVLVEPLRRQHLVDRGEARAVEPADLAALLGREVHDGQARETGDGRAGEPAQERAARAVRSADERGGGRGVTRRRHGPGGGAEAALTSPLHQHGDAVPHHDEGDVQEEQHRDDGEHGIGHPPAHRRRAGAGLAHLGRATRGGDEHEGQGDGEHRREGIRTALAAHPGHAGDQAEQQARHDGRPAVGEGARQHDRECGREPRDDRAGHPERDRRVREDVEPQVHERVVGGVHQVDGLDHLPELAPAARRRDDRRRLVVPDRGHPEEGARDHGGQQPDQQGVEVTPVPEAREGRAPAGPGGRGYSGRGRTTVGRMQEVRHVVSSPSRRISRATRW
jgi:hypothetical protein